MNMKKTLLVLLTLATLLMNFSCSEKKDNTLSLAISPYQDIAMIVNIKNLNLEKKYKVNVNLYTMNWEDILPAVASYGKTVDVGFGGLTEYLTKVEKINKNTDDPLLFIYPLYIYRGGGFIAFNKDVPVLNAGDLNDKAKVKQFFKYKIGAQKSSLYDMLLYNLARSNRIDYKSINIIDTPMDQGLLATRGGDLDIASAGLTQITEAKKFDGRLVLNMDDMGFADVTGFICKKSVLEKKRAEIDFLIKMWFECVDYVFEDIDKNSYNSLIYLDKNAATKYSLQGYKAALNQEYFPKTIVETEENIISEKGKYSYKKISEYVINYLVSNNIVTKKPEIPNFIKVDEM